MSRRTKLSALCDPEQIHPSLNLSFSPDLAGEGLLNSAGLTQGPRAPPDERWGQTPGRELQSSWEVLPLDPPRACGGRAWAGSRGAAGSGLGGSPGQVPPKGPGWASWTSGPGDLDPSPWNSDSGESPPRGERRWGRCASDAVFTPWRFPGGLHRGPWPRSEDRRRGRWARLCNPRGLGRTDLGATGI